MGLPTDIGTLAENAGSSRKVVNFLNVIIDLPNRTWFACFLVFAFTIWVALLYHPLKQIERGDSSIYDYIAQGILRGQVPYKDVIDPKAPLGMYLSALFIALGRLFKVFDITSIRFFHVILLGILSISIYLVTRRYFKNSYAGILAVGLVLLPWRFLPLMTTGTQPKLPMMIFAMLALVAIASDRPLWAGILSSLSCLCWQPGLLFAGVAFLIFSKYFTSWKDLKALKVVAGTAIPLLITLAYFFHKGALSQLVNWTFVYDYKVFMPTDEKPLPVAFAHFCKVVARIFNGQETIFFLGVGGLVWLLGRQVWARFKEKKFLTEDLYFDGLILAPLIYFAFCMVNFQSGPDLIPLLPFIGILGAFVFLQLGSVIGNVESLRKSFKIEGIQSAVVAVPLTIILAIVSLTAYRSRHRPNVLAEQRRQAGEVAQLLSPDDRVYVHGTAELLVLLNRPNMNPYVAFDTGADNYIAASVPGGFQSVLQQMEAQAPKILVISRLHGVRHRKELMDWVKLHYDKLDYGYLATVYVRRQGPPDQSNPGDQHPDETGAPYDPSAESM